MKNRKILIAVSVVLLVGVVTRLFWLTFLVVLIVGSYLLISNPVALRKLPWYAKRVKPVMVFLFIFCLAISVRLFLFEVFAIPSGSMEETLIPGDKIVVNKMIYGPQMPQSPFEIPWVNLFFYMTRDTATKIDSLWWGPKRLRGLSKIKRNDVLVFKNEPLAPGYFIKRCVALPGDELRIINSDLYLNGNYAESNRLPKVKKLRLVYSHNPSGLDRLLDSLQINRHIHSYSGDGRARELFLTTDEACRLQGKPVVDSVKVNMQPVNSNAWLYPYYRRELWSVDNYGPLKIPFKGWVLNLGDPIAILYLDMIEKWEGQPISMRHGRYYLDDNEVTRYTFKNDYYFIMGDNRHNSVDSRMWGILPEYKIVGKATGVLWSNDDGGFKWGRVLRKIS